ncbi:hypothetical protein CHS0354_016061 [Potamilus streckersoni]|uniref:Uncharacterized protein n=1 Tax=Potamilus streckersoni TaxID=2493646 RepID=A0AAE0T1Y5_9BIVA|nr:hypothetical protein CHS0354_016061 [Potamilus streckersoni]
MEAGACGMDGLHMEHVASLVVEVYRFKPGTGPALSQFPRMVEGSVMELQWNLPPLNMSEINI